MPIRVVPHAAEHRDAVHAFNLRMRAGGSKWGFYEDSEPDWVPNRPDAAVWREYHLAIEGLDNTAEVDDQRREVTLLERAQLLIEVVGAHHLEFSVHREAHDTRFQLGLLHGERPHRFLLRGVRSLTPRGYPDRGIANVAFRWKVGILV